MSTEDPQTGPVSADTIRWPGPEETAVARGRREPTSWTRPMRLTVACYLAGTALVDIVTNAIAVSVSSLEAAVRSASPGLSADEVHAQATVAYAVGWVFVVAVAAVYAVVAAGSFRGWRWAFWTSLVVLALRSIDVVTSPLALLNPSSRTPGWVSGLNLALAVIALALLVGLVIAAVRIGPWAMRRVSGRLPGP
jgi:hypothetical protein